MKKRVAIVIFGIFTNGIVLNTLKEKLFDNLNIDYDVFINVTEIRKYHESPKKFNTKKNELKTDYLYDIKITNELFNIDDYINNKRVYVKFPKEYVINTYKNIFGDKLKDIEFFNVTTPPANVTVNAVVYQRFYKLYDIIKKYEIDNNISYGAVAICRADYEVLKMDIELLKNYMDEVCNNENIVYISDMTKPFYYLYSNGFKFNKNQAGAKYYPRLDDFAIYKLENLSKNFFNELKEFIGKDNIIKYKDEMLKKHSDYPFNKIIGLINKMPNYYGIWIDFSFLPFLLHKNIEFKFIDYNKINLRKTAYDHLNNYI